MANLEPGTQIQLIKETTVAAGTTSKITSMMTDTVLATLWCSAITGTLTVNIYNMTDTGKEVLALSFPIVASPSTVLLLKRAPVTTSNIRVECIYTGVVTYEVYIRAINAGLVETRIVGAGNAEASQIDVTNVVTLIIPPSTSDRSGLVLKNWDTTATIYIGMTALQATPATGYPLAPKDALAVDLSAGQGIYAVADEPIADLRVLSAGG